MYLSKMLPYTYQMSHNAIVAFENSQVGYWKLPGAPKDLDSELTMENNTELYDVRYNSRIVNRPSYSRYLATWKVFNPN